MTSAKQSGGSATQYRLAVAGLIAALCAIGTPTASSQTARSGGGGNAQAMAQLQQLASERTAMAAELEKLKAELATLRKERDDAKAAAAKVQGRVQACAAETSRDSAARAVLSDDLEKSRKRTEELVARFRETAESLRQVEAERTTLTQAASVRDADLDSCVAKNIELAGIGNETLDHLVRDGGSSLGRIEPFTKIRRARIDNLVEEYRDRIADQKAKQTSANPAPNPAVPSR